MERSSLCPWDTLVSPCVHTDPFTYGFPLIGVMKCNDLREGVNCLFPCHPQARTQHLVHDVRSFTIRLIGGKSATTEAVNCHVGSSVLLLHSNVANLVMSLVK